jgi:hypothetical protein
MQVIDAYVNLLKAQDGLKNRQGGTVYLETACMKRVGENNETMDDIYPKRGHRPALVQRVQTYLEHDMVVIF